MWLHSIRNWSQHYRKICSYTHREGVRESRGITPLILYLGVSCRWMFSLTPRPLYLQWKLPGRVGFWMVWKILGRATSLDVDGIRTPDRPFRVLVNLLTQVSRPHYYYYYYAVSSMRVWELDPNELKKVFFTVFILGGGALLNSVHLPWTLLTFEFSLVVSETSLVSCLYFHCKLSPHQEGASATDQFLAILFIDIICHWYNLLTPIWFKHGGSFKYTFTHKRYTKQHNEIEYNTYITIKIHKRKIRLHKHNNKGT